MSSTHSLSSIWVNCGWNAEYLRMHEYSPTVNTRGWPSYRYFLYLGCTFSLILPQRPNVSLHFANQFLVRRSSSWWLEVKLPFNVCLQIWICVSLWVRSRDSTGDKTPTGDFFSFAWKSYGKWSTSAWNLRCCILISPSLQEVIVLCIVGIYVTGCRSLLGLLNII